MKKKSVETRKTVRVTVRFAKKEYERVKILAATYSAGNVAEWLRHGALEGERKFLK